MENIVKGFMFIGAGIKDLIMSFILLIVKGFMAIVKRIRAYRLKRATAYVNRYGFELNLDSKVRVAGKAYYVGAVTWQECIDHKREVQVALLGVPQYREIKRRLRETA